MSEYVQKYDNLLIEFNDTKNFNKQLKKNIEELKKLEQKYLDNKNELKDNDKMPYLETEKDAAENISDIYERRNDIRRKEYGIDINGLDRDGNNINGIDKNGTDRDGYNINGIKGTKKKYPKKNLKHKKDDDGVLYDQYGFNLTGFNKDGYDIYGFDIDGLNKDGLNKFGYKKIR